MKLKGALSSWVMTVWNGSFGFFEACQELFQRKIEVKTHWDSLKKEMSVEKTKWVMLEPARLGIQTSVGRAAELPVLFSSSSETLLSLLDRTKGLQASLANAQEFLKVFEWQVAVANELVTVKTADLVGASFFSTGRILSAVLFFWGSCADCRWPDWLADREIRISIPLWSWRGVWPSSSWILRDIEAWSWLVWREYLVQWWRACMKFQNGLKFTY